MPSLKQKLLSCVCVCSLLITTIPILTAAAVAGPMWTYKPGSELKWHDLTGLGTILVGSDQSIVCLDQESGNVIWKREDLKNVAKYQVEEVPGTPLLLASANAGGKTRLYALDISTGETIWETEQLK